MAQAAEVARSDGFQKRFYQAIAVQRPAVVEVLRALRREKPAATPAEILRELEKRYVATVTTTSTGVGASAAIPTVGIPVAIGLGIADLLFFAEASAIYVLAATELHGIPVADPERARPLVLGALLGPKSHSKVAKFVAGAAGAGGVDQARDLASGTVGKVLPHGWGETLTQQLPDSALAPLTTVIAREAFRTSAVLGAGTLGKVVPFGIGALIGGLGSYSFSRDVVKATRLALPSIPEVFPESLSEFEKPRTELLRSSRAIMALQSASQAVTRVGAKTWGTAVGAAGAAGRATSAAAGAVAGAVSGAVTRVRGRRTKPEPPALPATEATESAETPDPADEPASRSAYSQATPSPSRSRWLP